MADRIEREIEEILRKIDKFVPDGGRPRRAPRRTARPFLGAQGWVARRVAAVSLGHVIWWSLLVVIIAFFVRGVPGMSWLMIGALIVFGTAFVLSLGRGSRATRPEKRWRDRPLDLSGPSWPDRLKAWLKARKRA